MSCHLPAAARQQARTSNFAVVPTINSKPCSISGSSTWCVLEPARQLGLNRVPPVPREMRSQGSECGAMGASQRSRRTKARVIRLMKGRRLRPVMTALRSGSSASH